MKLTKAQRSQRDSLIEARHEAHPAAGYAAAVEWGATTYRQILEEARAEAQRPQLATPEELAAMGPDEFSAEFGARLTELGSLAGHDSPIWQ